MCRMFSNGNHDVAAKLTDRVHSEIGVHFNDRGVHCDPAGPTRKSLLAKVPGTSSWRGNQLNLSSSSMSVVG